MTKTKRFVTSEQPNTQKSTLKNRIINSTTSLLQISPFLGGKGSLGNLGRSVSWQDDGLRSLPSLLACHGNDH